MLVYTYIFMGVLMKFRSLIFTLASLVFFSSAVLGASETYSNKIQNFYGVENFPLLPGEYNFIYADEITYDGSYNPVDSFVNSRPNSSIEGELRTGTVESYISEANSVRLNFAILQDGSYLNLDKKSFYACNIVRDPLLLVSSNIEVFDDESFVEYCTFKNSEFDFVTFNYTYCSDKCIELQYTYFLSNLKDQSKESIGELGMRIYNNLDRAFNGIYYDFNFIEAYLK